MYMDAPYMEANVKASGDAQLLWAHPKSHATGAEWLLQVEFSAFCGFWLITIRRNKAKSRT